ncbi:MAG: molybdenum cofactor guanylyltransferase MobA [Rhodospirillales bacterium]|nr:molybdenum cofactor guanylyltransferase MobA [Rhodospirillales bacterium]
MTAARKPDSKAPADVAGVLLAGGLARRMGGGDKGMRRLGGRPIMERILARVRPQVTTLLVNANGDPARFEGYGLPVMGDVVGGYAGPLAGVLTGLEWAAEHAPAGTRFVASFAIDAPFVPLNLVARLRRAVEDEGAEIACAKSGDRTHPVFGLWPLELAAELKRAMIEEEMRKIDRWTVRYDLVEVDFPTEPFDPFFNINDPGNLAEAERLLGAERGAA